MEIDSIEYKLSWIHTLLYDALEELPTDESKEHLINAIQSVEECENIVESINNKE